MISIKNLIRLGLNTLLGAVLVYFWLKIINLDEVIANLSRVNYYFALLFIVVFAMPTVFRALRIKLMLSEHKIPYRNLLSLTYLSQLLSFIIPLRIGELAKAVYLSTEYKVAFPKAVILIFLDRFLDFWVVLVFASLLLLIVPTQLPGNVQFSLMTLILVSSLGLAMVMFLPKLSRTLVSLISKLLIFKILQKYFTQISLYIIDTAGLLGENLPRTGKMIFLTFVAVVVDALGWYVLFLAAFKPTDFSFLQIQLGSLLSSLTYVIPAAPGYVGSAEASGVAVFGYGLGLDKTLTAVVTILAHGLTLLDLLVLGLLGLYTLKFNLNLVWKKLRKE